MKLFGYSGPQVRKFIMAGVGAAVSIATQVLALGDVVPPEIANWATVIVSIGTAVGVFGVPNAQKSEASAEPAKTPIQAARRRRPVI